MFRIQIQLDYFLGSINIHALIVCFQLEEMDQERVIFSMVSWQLFQPLKVQFFQCKCTQGYLYSAPLVLYINSTVPAV